MKYLFRTLTYSRLQLILSLALAVLSCAAFLAPAQAATNVQYTISFSQPQTHLYEVTFEIGQVTTPQLDLQMPTWTPGSYLQREFARNVQDFAVTDASGQPLRWEKIDKATWRVTTGGAPGIRASYRVYAYELSVRTSHLDATHAYFNGASVFMYVQGAAAQPLKLKINAPAGWRVTTPLALAPDADGWYSAPNYDVLVDSPAEIGTHKLLEFDVLGKRHRIAIWGEGNYDEARLKADLAKIVQQGAALFGGLPYEHYTFIVHLQMGAGGGLEHLNSTTLQSGPFKFQPHKTYLGFLKLAAHEYFHLWNVKRIRPAALGPFDYQHENYTRALWLSEGVTDYYAPLLLRRAGLMTETEYLEDLADEIKTYEQTPGRRVQSAESASYDAWIKYYRPDENTPNTAISYYLKGKLLGAALDLEIRSRTKNAKSLDDVLRYLYEHYARRGVGFPEAELTGAFEQVAGGDLTDFFARYVSGTAELDLDHALRVAGLQLTRTYHPAALDEAKGQPRGTLGLKTKNTGDRVIVSSALAGLPAYQSGVSVNDEIVAVNGWKVDATNLAEQLGRLQPGQPVTLTLFRRERLLTVNLTPAKLPPDRYSITPVKEALAEQQALRKDWLSE